MLRRNGAGQETMESVRKTNISPYLESGKDRRIATIKDE